MAETETATAVVDFIPPPRTTGDNEADLPAALAWLQQFWEQAVRENGFLKTADQQQSSGFDPGNLPDPANTTLADAQQTANDAYQLADSANTAAQAFIESGTLTVSNTDTSAVFTFSEPEPNASYQVAVTPTAKTGAPATNSRIVDTVTKATTGVTVNLIAAPGAATSISFDIVAFRNST